MAAVDEKVKQIIVEQLGVDEGEVRRAAARMQAGAIYAQDSLAGPANIVGTALAIGQSLDDVALWPERAVIKGPVAVQVLAIGS